MLEPRRTLYFAMISLLLVVFGACTREAATPARSTPSGERSSGADHASPSAIQQATGSGMVRILPEAPTAQTDLQVQHGSVGSITYQWFQNNMPIAGENAEKLSAKFFKKNDTVSVTVTADGVDASTAVIIGNSLPEVVTAILSPDRICRGVDIVAAVQAVDADNDTIRFSYIWRVNNTDLYGDSNTLKGDQFRKGDRVSIIVTPYDNDGPGKVFTSKEFFILNASPVFISTPPVTFNNDTYSYQAVAEDPDGDVIRYNLASGPPGMTIDSKSGKVAWQIKKEDIGTHNIEIIAQDGSGASVSQKFPLEIAVPEK